MNPLVASTSEIYELLVSLLSQSPQTIEIIPGDGSLWMHTENGYIESEPSFAPFLFVEGNLGIPQKILHKVYLHAVDVFKSVRSRAQTRLMTMVPPSTSGLDPSLVRVLDASSSILLLANPSHQTALNARKRLVRMDFIDPHAELCFIASLLPSQHYAKHAELWYHRRWLLSFGSNAVAQSSDTGDVESHCRLRFTSQEVLRQELVLVSRACEAYPRNYFAWAHQLICMQSLLSDHLTGVDGVGFLPIFHGEIRRVKGWIDRHVSDYSAIHNILTLSQAASHSSDLAKIVTQEGISDHAISLVQEYPAHEALWMYTWIAISILDFQQAEQFIEHFVQPLVHLQHLETDVKEDLVNASQCARLFLSRLGYKCS